VENDTGELEYSQSHHDYKRFDNGNMIDGGRVYIRGNNCKKVYVVQNGAMERVILSAFSMRVINA
jgi:hypothetical protein